jgi:hypothetical protein
VKTHGTTAARRPTPETSFRLLLQSELVRRCADNPQYSLRAFAMHLGADHSTLGQQIRGKRPLTPASIETLGRALGLDRARIDAYVASEHLLVAAAAAGREARELARDTASLVSDWWHFAILELLRLPAFRPDSRWIARVLGIPVDDVNRALSALLHLRLMEMRDAAKWVDTSGDAALSFEDFTRVAVERYADEMRRLTIEAAGAVPSTRRDKRSLTVAVATSRVPEAIEAIARFHRELAALLESAGRDERDAVYKLETDFFPLTRAEAPQEQRPWAVP